MIGVATDRVRERCGLPDGAQDQRINNLIGEMVPALSRLLLPSALEDETLRPLLSLGATELVAAEMLGILSREAGELDVVTIGDLRIEPSLDDGAKLRAIGERRLAPFVRPDLARHLGVIAGAAVASGLGGLRN